MDEQNGIAAPGDGRPHAADPPQAEGVEGRTGWEHEPATPAYQVIPVAVEKGTRRHWARWGHGLLLALVLVAALALRLYHVNWDEGQHTHPDERWIAMVASDLGWPASLKEAMDPRSSPANPLWVARDNSPRSFAYGHLPLYLITLCAALLEKLGSLGPRLAAIPSLAGALSSLARVTSYDQINLLGRVLSALADVGSVGLIYLMGKRLYGRWVGLLGAALVAFTVSHIQLAHYAAFDTFATFFIALTVYGAIRLWQDGRPRDVWLTGVAAGLAISSKFSAMPILAAVALACLARALEGSPGGGKGDPGLKLDAKRIEAAFKLGVACLALAVLFFAITSPYALLDAKRFMMQIGEQGAMVRGVADMPYTRQYRPTQPFVYQIEQQLRWGMGWPLGLLAFAGFAYLIGRNLRRRFRWGDLIVLSWALPYFLINGSFMVKFMRYMLPLLPFLSLMGAELLASLWRASPGKGLARLGVRGSALRILSAALAGIVLVSSVVYSVAFVRIFAREHTWITASRWIYAHVPDGSVLAVEHWDDNLPKSLPEPGMNPGARGYRHVELPMYEPDTRAKLSLIQQVLGQADYIVLSTNRLYRTIPALPERYPLSTRFYELLFAEELGFQQVAVFTSYPGIGPWQIVDDAADESFTVYDHPKPIIFQKVRDPGEGEFMALFAGALAITPQWDFRPPATAEVREGKSLLLDQPVETLPVVAGIGWNQLANASAPLAIVLWWLLIQAMGLLALPLTLVVFRHLGDRGYILAKSLGWIIIGFVNWWLASLRLLPNTIPTLLLCGALLGALSFWVWRRRGLELGAWLRDNARLVLFNEALFGVAYFFFCVVRILNPDLWQPWFGGEKLMEMAFLNATLRSPYFPPYDPYFAGGYLNYYYYGQYLVSIPIKLLGLTASVGFNLAVPTLFALTIANAYSVGVNLVKGQAARVAGLLSALSVAVLGNLTAMSQLVGGWLRAGAGQASPSGAPVIGPLRQLLAGILAVASGGVQMPAFDYWHESTRVIPHTINEFPFFSFLFADLHPHMINIPFTVLVVALLVNLARGTRENLGGEQGLGEHFLRFMALPLALGALGPINTWEMPTYLGLTLLVLAFHTGRVYARWPWGILAARFGATALLSLALYWPFYQHYQAISVGIGLVDERSPLGPMLLIWGLFVFVLASFAWVSLSRHKARHALLRYVRIVAGHMAYLPHVLDLHSALVRKGSVGYLLARYGLWVGIALTGALALGGQWPLALLWPLVLLAGLLLLRDDAGPGVFMTHLLIFTGMLIILGCEVVYMEDFLGGGDWRRMNTLFKFYTQVWVLLGLALGAVLPRLWAWASSWRPQGLRWAWRVACGLLLLSALLYPVMAIPARIQQRFPRGSPPVGTLDGMAYMTVGVYTWPDENHPIELVYDYQAIRWLQENVKGTPVIAEGRIDYYREGGMRVSSFTGLPTLLGAHQGEQRYAWQVGQRDGLARDFYNTPDLQRAVDIAEQLHIRYVYVGQLERYVYNAAGLAKFEQMVERGLLEVVYENEKARIYRFLN